MLWTRTRVSASFFDLLLLFAVPAHELKMWLVLLECADEVLSYSQNVLLSCFHVWSSYLEQYEDDCWEIGKLVEWKGLVAYDAEWNADSREVSFANSCSVLRNRNR